MKVFALLLFLSFNAHAFDSQIFQEGYPQFFNFEALLLSDLRNYFESLPKNSLIYADTSESILFRARNKNGDLINIHSRIERVSEIDKMVERTIFQLDNGSTFLIEIIRKGKDLRPSSNEDLFEMKVVPHNEEFFQMSLPSFGVFLSLESRSAQNETGLFKLGMMDLSVQIEKNIRENSADLNYIYFFKGMPNPQSSLGVRAENGSGEWSPVQFLFFSGQGGQLTPKQFFGGLADGSRAFSEASVVMKKILIGLGFPEL